MKISEVIEELQRIQSTHGDVPVKFGNSEIECVRFNSKEGRNIRAELLSSRPEVFISNKPLVKQ